MRDVQEECTSDHETRLDEALSRNAHLSGAPDPQYAHRLVEPQEIFRDAQGRPSHHSRAAGRRHPRLPPSRLERPHHLRLRGRGLAVVTIQLLKIIIP